VVGPTVIAGTAQRLVVLERRGAFVSRCVQHRFFADVLSQTATL
jgi:hypothetical protein